MKMISIALILLALTFTACVSTRPGQSAVRVEHLRCESLVNPSGIDAREPRLAWQLHAKERGQRQTAYEIRAASSFEKLHQANADLWASGKIISDQSIQIAYAGQPLGSRQQCFWQVRIWDKAGQPSAWSAPAFFSMGLLAPGDWQAKWIGYDEPVASTNENRPLPARMLRKEFAVTKPIARATVYYSGLGLSELYVNGTKTGDAVLSPGLTDYTKRVFYLTADVTAQLHPGANALGVWLGNGRFYAPRSQVPSGTVNYGYPKLLLQLEVEYADGSRATIVSDESWQLTTNGPITANNEYDGEDYDARREFNGWDQAGFNGNNWQPAEVVSAPGGQLVAPMIDPIRVTETLKPVKLTEPKPGVFIYDFGQNMVGWCRLKVRGPAGAMVTLRHAETLKPDGTLYLDNLRSARVTDTYTLKGGGTETYEPRFTYHGFRFVELAGYPGRPALADLEGCVVHDDVASTGEWSSSNELLNRIFHNVRWGILGNYRSFPTDCPQRDERQGWLGDRSAECRGESYLFDVAALCRKWLQDMADAQKPSGSVSDVCPAYWPIYSDNVTWPSSTVLIPGMLWEQYADTQTVTRHYASMTRWVDYMSGFITNGIIGKDQYGDWCVPPENAKLIHSQDPLRKTHPEILATSYFAHDLAESARYAKLLGKTTDAERFTALAGQLKIALNEKYFNAAAGYYDNGSQTACVLPLAFGLVSANQRERVQQRLTGKIINETKNHVGTGLIGGQWLMRTLTASGQGELAYTIATQKTYPSWGYMVANGATTIWELWNGNTADPAMNSGNHVMLVGDLVIWLYESLAGIQSDPAQPGFKHIIMHPQPVGDLQWIKATHLSLYGKIVSQWQRTDESFDWQITVPPNSTATVYVPANSPENITESGQPSNSANGVKFMRLEKQTAVFEVESGSYRFHSTNYTKQP
jgi:alpha-L-rhamnosidase